MTEKEGWEYHVSGLCSYETCKHCQREAAFIKWSEFPGMAKSTRIQQVFDSLSTKDIVVGASMKEKIKNRPKMSASDEKRWADDWSDVEQNSKGEIDE